MKNEIRTIVGVPGAGKTTRLSEVIINKFNADLGRIIIVSLTNATFQALAQKLGFQKKRNSFRTVYGLAYIKMLNEGLLDDWKKKFLDPKKNFKAKIKILKKIGVKPQFLSTILPETPSEVIFSIITRAIFEKGNPEAFSEYFNEYSLWGLREYQIQEVIEAYKRGHFYDYSFLVYEAIFKYELDIAKVFLKSNGIYEELEPEAIFIDEFQDFPYLLFEVFKKTRMWLAGDPAQGIFTFLGAKPDKILSLSEIDYITQTKRFGKNISSLANRILKRMGYEYRIKPANIEDKVYLVYNHGAFIRKVKEHLKANDDMIILGRSHYILKRLSNLLSFYNIPTIFLQGVEEIEFLKRFTKIFDEWIKAKVNGQSVQFLRQIGFPFKIQNLFDFAKIKEPEKEEVVKFLTYKVVKDLNFKPKRRFIKLAMNVASSNKFIPLSTIHSVKGLEFNTVFFYAKIPRLVLRKLDSYNDYKDELKTIFVGITRAKKNLYILREPNDYFEYFSLI